MDADPAVPAENAARVTLLSRMKGLFPKHDKDFIRRASGVVARLSDETVEKILDLPDNLQVILFQALIPGKQLALEQFSGPLN